MPADLTSTVYTPASPLSRPANLVRSMYADLMASRQLAWRLFIRDINAQYRQSVLGYFWAFLPAIATAATFTFLKSQNILSVGETPIAYPAFVLIGTLLWQTFLGALNCPLRVLGSARVMLAKINFPRESLLLSGAGEVVFNLLIRLTLLVPVFLVYDISVGRSILLFPMAVLALLVLGLSIGLLLTPLGMLYGDIARGITLAASFWMLLTPVVYPAPDYGFGALLATWNPVSPVLLTARELLISQPVSQPGAFALVGVGAGTVLAAGWVLYRVAMPHVIARIGS